MQVVTEETKATVAERLKASAERSDRELEEAGALAGRQWAEERAEAIELRRLARYVERGGLDFDTSPNPGAGFVNIIAPDWAEDGLIVDQLCYLSEELDIPQHQAEEPAFMQAFAGAALSVWQEAKP